MQNRALNVGLGAVIVALVAGWSGRGIKGREPQAVQHISLGADAAAAPGDPAPTDDSIVTGSRLLESFFGDSLENLERCSQRSTCYDLDFLIVMLPDPLDSFLDWSFDADLESVRRAFESAQYVTDRFWFPWDADRRPTRDRRQSLYRREHPGVLLLRSSDPNKHSLRIVYVVGEVSTAGVHKRAFEAALEERRALLAKNLFADSTGARDTIRILGPFFTGASLSERQTLEHWRRKTSDTTFAHFVSGSATGLANLSILDSRSTTAARAARMSFRATVNSDLTLNLAMLRVIGDSGFDIPPEHIALLQESSTQYGQQAAPSDTALPVQLAGHARTDDAGPERILAAPKAEVARATRDMLVVSYPLSIASLRSEYAKHPEPANGADALSRSPAPRIPLALNGSNQQLESPIPLAELTPASLDLMIDEVTRTLRAHDIRAIGLIGTDVRDKIFLAQQLRHRLPDVRLFTFGSNNLYLREDYNDVLRGMLVFSTYPLLLQNQWWTVLTNSRQRRTAFGSDDAQGVYNATLVHLRRAWLKEYRTPFDATEGTPPVWVTAVGRHSFIPLRTFESLAGANEYLAPRPRGSQQVQSGPERHIPSSDWIAWLLFVALAAAISFLVLRDDAESRVRIPIGDRKGEATATYSTTTNPVVTRESSTEEIAMRRFVDRRRFGLKAALLLHREIYTFVRHLALLCGFAALAVIVMPQSTDYRNVGPVAPIVYSVLSVLALAALMAFWARIRQVWGEWGIAYRDYVYHPPHKWMEREIARLRRVMSRIERHQVVHLLSMLTPTIEYEIRALAPRAERSAWRTEGMVIAVTGLFGVLYATAVTMLIVKVNLVAMPEATLFVYRAAQLDSGISPLFPIVVSSVALAFLCSWQLSRLTLLDEVTAFEEAFQFGTGKPAQTDADEIKSRVAQGLQAVRIHLSRVAPQLPSGVGKVLVPLLAAVLAILLWFHFERSFEAITALHPASGMTAFDAVFRLSILMVFAAASWALIRLVMVWRALRRTMQALAASPLVTAFERLPRRVARLTRLTLFADPSQETVLAVSATQWMHLRRLYSTNEPAFAQADPQASGELRTLMADEAPLSGGKHRRAGATFAPGLKQLLGVIERLWDTEPADAQVDAVLGDLKKQAQIDGASTSGRIRRSFPDPVRLWVRSAEEFVAVQAVDYIAWVLRHLRRIVLMLLFLLVVMMALLSSYEFFPQSIVRSLFLALFIAAVVSLLLVLTQMNRDEVLSRVTRTDPGRLNWDAGFLLNVAVVVAMPLLSLLSAFSPVRTDLFDWLDVVLRSITTH